MKIYTYVRVSTQSQDFARQEQAVKKYCEENNIVVDREFSDKVSGKTFERNEYLEMKKLVEKDDVIIIKELDRFGRSMELIKEEWNYFMKKGVRIIVIDMPLISSDLNGKKTLDMQFIANLVFEVLCYSAEKEREKISNRTKEALAVKKQSGVKLGRKFERSEEEINKIMEDYVNGMRIIDIADKYNISVDRIHCYRRMKNIPKRKC